MFTTFVETSNGRELAKDIGGLRDGTDGGVPLELFWTGVFGQAASESDTVNLHTDTSVGSAVGHLDEGVHPNDLSHVKMEEQAAAILELANPPPLANGKSKQPNKKRAKKAKSRSKRP